MAGVDLDVAFGRTAIVSSRDQTRTDVQSLLDHVEFNSGEYMTLTDIDNEVAITFTTDDITFVVRDGYCVPNDELHLNLQVVVIMSSDQHLGDIGLGFRKVTQRELFGLDGTDKDFATWDDPPGTFAPIDNPIGL